MSRSVRPLFGDPVPEFYERLRQLPSEFRQRIRIAVLEAAASGQVLDPDAFVAELDQILVGLEDTTTVALAHLIGAAERVRLGEQERAEAHLKAEHRVQKALADITSEAVADGFNPQGWFVYCLWGEDQGRPIYVGKSLNVLARLGDHLRNPGRGYLIRRVTLLRCKDERQMDVTERRLITRYQPPLNIQGIQPATSTETPTLESQPPPPRRRDKGEGSIVWRNMDRRWEGKAYFPGGRKSVYGHSRSEVAAKLRRLLELGERGQPPLREQEQPEAEE